MRNGTSLGSLHFLTFKSYIPYLSYSKSVITGNILLSRGCSRFCASERGSLRHDGGTQAALPKESQGALLSRTHMQHKGRATSAIVTASQSRRRTCNSNAKFYNTRMLFT